MSSCVAVAPLHPVGSTVQGPVPSLAWPHSKPGGRWDYLLSEGVQPVKVSLTGAQLVRVGNGAILTVSQRGLALKTFVLEFEPWNPRDKGAHGSTHL